jgi:hypothetical protein
VPNGKKPEGRRGGVARVLKTSAVVMVPILAAAGLTLYLAPWQEQRAQKGVEDARAKAQIGKPSLALEQAVNVSFDEPDSFLFPSLPSAATASYLGGKHLDQERIKTAVQKEGGLEIVTLDNELREGGLAANRIRLTVVGRTQSPALVTDISARIISKEPPWSSGFIYTEPQGATAAEGLGFDLSSSNLKARRINKDALSLGDIRKAPSYLLDKQVTIARDERVTFDVVALVADASVKWVIDFTTSDGQTLTATNNGKPWQSSSLSPSYKAAWSRNFTPDGSIAYRSCVWPRCGAQMANP